MSIKTFGIKVSLDGEDIGGLTSVTPGGKDLNFIQTTTHSNVDGVHRFLGGLLDNGALELEGNYDIEDDGQLKIIDNPAAIKPVIITFSDESRSLFNAVVGAYNITNPLDDVVGFTSSLKVTGEIETVTSGSKFAILDPAGENNEILLTSTSTLFESAEILIDDDVDRTQLTVTADTPLVEIVSGDKYILDIVANRTAPSVTNLTGRYVFDQVINGKPSHTGLSGLASTRWSGSEWQIRSGSESVFISSEDVATPDLVTSWTVQPSFGGAGSVSSITPNPATAAQVITAINAANITGLTASNAPGSDGTGFVAGTATVNFI